MGFRGVYRGVYSSLIDDEDFQTLTPHARLTLLTLRICRDAGPAVIFRYYPEVLARQTGLDLEGMNLALVELAEAGWIERERSVIWVKNGLRYDPTMRLSNEKHLAAVCRAVAALPKVSLRLRFLEYYQIVEAFNRLSDGYRIPRRPEYREPSSESDNPLPNPIPIHRSRSPKAEGRLNGPPGPPTSYEALVQLFMTMGKGMSREEAEARIAKGS